MSCPAIVVISLTLYFVTMGEKALCVFYFDVVAVMFSIMTGSFSVFILNSSLGAVYVTA